MRHVLIAVLVGSTALLAGKSSAAPIAEGPIKQTFAQLDRCVANSDAPCIGELMVDDATMVAPEGGQLIKGRAQVVSNLKQLMSPASGGGGPKRTHSVQNVRMIGEDYAIVDCDVMRPGAKPVETFHAVAVMTRKGDKWLLMDLRSYVVDRRPADERAKAAAPGPTPPKNPSTPGPTPPGPNAPGAGPAGAGIVPTSPASVPKMPPGGAAPKG